MAGCVSVLSLLVCLCHWGACTALLLVEPARGKAAGASTCLGRDPGSLRSGLGPQRLGEVALYFAFYLT